MAVSFTGGKIRKTRKKVVWVVGLLKLLTLITKVYHMQQRWSRPTVKEYLKWCGSRHLPMDRDFDGQFVRTACPSLASHDIAEKLMMLTICNNNAIQHTLQKKTYLPQITDKKLHRVHQAKGSNPTRKLWWR